MTYRTRIKMCGTTTIEDAMVAVQLGIDALGFIFVKNTPRFISPEDANKIVKQLPPFLFRVGVFVNDDRQEVEEIVRCLGLNGIQLHGKEKPSYCEKLALSMPSCSLIKAFRVGEKSSPTDFVPYNDVVNGFLLDTYVQGKDGGTGLSFDWSVLPKLKLKLPAIVAGGLSPENIQEALTIARPFAVDVNSGIELSPGKKDHNKLKCFVEKVAQSDSTK